MSGSTGIEIIDNGKKNVKLDKKFELKLPSHPINVDKGYYWTALFDNNYIDAYLDINRGTWYFKPLKKGKTIIIMQLHERDGNHNERIVKTVIYHINIKKSLLSSIFS